MPDFRSPHPQTIIQLYNALIEGPYSEGDLADIRDTWRLAKRVFSCRFTSSGKLFLAHVVGVAGVLASTGASSTAIRAALVHNVYQNGRFREGGEGVTPRRRRRLRRFVGVDVERRVFQFSSVEWLPESIAPWLDDHNLPTWKIDLLELRLADAIDHTVSAGLVVRGDAGGRDYYDQIREISVELGLRHGHAELARRLETEAQNPQRYILPPEVAAELPGDCVVLTPKSRRGGLAHGVRKAFFGTRAAHA